MPALGDFFHFGLSRAFIAAWDDWLQSAIAAARRALGEGWQQRYLSAPIWRFSLAPGLAGGEGMLGVLMPSVDRVGRHFPLTLAAPTAGNAPTLELHFAAAPTFEALEAVALDTLALHTDLPGLQRSLAAMTPLQLDMPAAVMQQAGSLTMRTCGGSLAGGLAAWALGRKGNRVSAWSMAGDGDSRLMILDGLPGEVAARGLFDLAAPIWGGAARGGA